MLYLLVFALYCLSCLFIGYTYRLLKADNIVVHTVEVLTRF